MMIFGLMLMLANDKPKNQMAKKGPKYTFLQWLKFGAGRTILEETFDRILAVFSLKWTLFLG